MSLHGLVSLGVSSYLLFNSASQVLCISVSLCTPVPDFSVHLCLWLQRPVTVMRYGICHAKNSLEKEAETKMRSCF